MGIILVTEIAASILMTVGVYQLYTSELKEMAILGIELSAISLIFLLIGQRLAKDYAGAMTLAVYFIVSIMGLYLLTN